MNDNIFRGPVFVTGMPRSGTKLLRNLLNNHSQLSIPVQESHLIPFIIRNFGSDYDFNQAGNLEKLVTAFRETKFFFSYPEKADKVNADLIRQSASVLSWSSFFEYIFRLYAEKEDHSFRIWGDKTPGYIVQFELFVKIFPGARFVHIVRDPRDYALSVKNAWGRSMYRAADRWNETMAMVDKMNTSKENYLEITYEDLLESPEAILTRICHFLGLEYEEGMQTVNQKLESYGEARGQNKIVATNKQKFLKKMSPSTLKRVESLVCEQAKRLSYELVHDVQYKPLTSMERKLLKLHDGYRSSVFHMKEKGIVQGLWYFIAHYRQRSWQKAE